MTEKTLLIGIRLDGEPLDYLMESLGELKELAESAGAIVADIIIQNRKEIDNKYYIGRGKLEEIAGYYKDEDINLIIFNNELSPTQAKNIEEMTDIRVITRTELILDIFAIHAKTKTSKYQVELAQLSYMQSRLVGKGISMSRTRGGIGLRGPGEQQLELDRRLIRKRISYIEKKIKRIDINRDIQRKNRMNRVYRISIVGYTNSGKSSLLNLLTGSKVIARDRMFSTLDTTTRKLWLGDAEHDYNKNAVITDTVGFIRDIPHTLVKSFKTTLEDITFSNLLIHLIDANSKYINENIGIVSETLSEIGAKDIPFILCFNKIDLISTEVLLDIRMKHPEAVYISCIERKNIDSLKKTISEHMHNFKY